MYAANDYADPPTHLPPTQKQVLYARRLAQQTSSLLPWDVLQDRRRLSAWIDARKAEAVHSTQPTSRQVAFAERIARIKRLAVPDECFRDRNMLSRWIDTNKPA